MFYISKVIAIPSPHLHHLADPSQQQSLLNNEIQLVCISIGNLSECKGECVYALS